MIIKIRIISYEHENLKSVLVSHTAAITSALYILLGIIAKVYILILKMKCMRKHYAVNTVKVVVFVSSGIINAKVLISNKKNIYLKIKRNK